MTRICHGKTGICGCGLRVTTHLFIRQYHRQNTGIHEKSLSHSDQAGMLKGAVKIGLKQFGLGHLTEDQKSTLIGMLLKSSAELYSRDGARSASILLAVWQATGDEEIGSMHRFARFGFSFRNWRRANLLRDIIRLRFWHPVLNATRPVRHALGLRQEKFRPSMKK